MWVSELGYGAVGAGAAGLLLDGAAGVVDGDWAGAVVVDCDGAAGLAGLVWGDDCIVVDVLVLSTVGVARP
jgi:hypothetical protein